MGKNSSNSHGVTILIPLQIQDCWDNHGVDSLTIDENSSPADWRRPSAALLCNWSGSDSTRAPEKQNKQRRSITFEQGAELTTKGTVRVDVDETILQVDAGNGMGSWVSAALPPVLMRDSPEVKTHAFLFRAKDASRRSRSPPVPTST